MPRKSRTRKQRRAILRGKSPKGGWYEERHWSLAAMGYTSYADYLRSAMWRSIRSEVLRRSSGVCEVCRSAPAREIHHRSYVLPVMKGKRLDLLVACCHDCHSGSEFTGREKNSPKEANRKMARSAWKKGIVLPGICKHCRRNPTKDNHAFCGRCERDAADKTRA